jgi:hypothetical protein
LGTGDWEVGEVEEVGEVGEVEEVGEYFFPMTTDNRQLTTDKERILHLNCSVIPLSIFTLMTIIS